MSMISPSVTSIALRACGVIGLLVIGSCGLAPQSSTMSHAAPNSDAAAKVATLSQTAPYSARFEIYTDLLTSSYERTFSAVIQQLKEQEDPLVNADLDHGIIVSGEGRHGVIGFPSWGRYFIILEPATPNTRITFRLCSYYWDDRNYPANQFVRAPDDRSINETKAGQFVQRVKNAMQHGG